MSDVDVQLVREFFELNLFHVLTYWQQNDVPLPFGDADSRLFVENIRPGPETDVETLLLPLDLPAVQRAVVEVRPWHADRMYPYVIQANPILSQFVQEDALAPAREIFGGQPFRTILVISELPASIELRAKALELLQEAGVNHVIEFPTLLHDLLQKVAAHGSYGASQTLHTLRLLKRYQLVRFQQMEFAFSGASRSRRQPPPPDAAQDIEPEEDE